jgi:proline iminopeptidase
MKIVVIASIIIGLILIVIGYFWYKMGQPLYKPGMVRKGENLSGGLIPPTQSGEPNYWNVESDIKLFHFSSGNGENILVIHGGPGAPFHKPMIGLQGLEGSYKFNYYDQRGAGRSSRPFDKFSENFYNNMTKLERKLGIGAQIADIERIRKILGEDKLTIIGHSFGAFLATLYACEFPENVKALILVAPATTLILPNEEDNFYGKIRNLLPENMKNEYDEFQKKYFDFKGIFSNSESDMVAMNSEFGKYYLTASKIDFSLIKTKGEPSLIGGWMVQAMFFSMGKKHDYRDALKNIKSPTLVIHGGIDLQSEKSSKVYSDLIPNSKFYVIKDAAHFVFNEKPEEFGKVVSDFLKSVN